MPTDDMSGLSRTNDELRREIAERKRAEEELEQRNRLLSTLLDVSNLTSSTLKLKPLLEAILDRLKTIIDYNGAKIFAIDGQALRVIAHRSILPEDYESSYFFVYKHMPMSREIIYEKKAAIISDVLSDTPMARAFRESMKSYLEGSFSYIRSWVGIPLVVKDKVIGVLTIDHSEPGYYLPKHAEIGTAFANQAALEFENARLYNETLKRADELKTMFSVQQAITSRLELDGVMQFIADEAKRLTSSESAAVFMAEGSDLVLSVFSGKGSAAFVGYRMDINSTLIGQSVIYGKPLIINNAQNNPVAYPGIVEKLGINSFICIPLMSGTGSTGVIAVADKTAGEFVPEDEHILSMLASIAVIGIENARMYQEERKRHLEDETRRHVAEGLRDILAILNSNRPLSEILDYIIRQAARLMGTDAGALYRLKNDRGLLTIRASCGLSQKYIEQMDVPVGIGVIGSAVAGRKPVVVPDITAGVIPEEFMEDPIRKPHLTWLMSRYNSLLAVPLVCKDEVYGGILLYCPRYKEFSKDEIDLAMTFADQAALAIDNARLREQAGQIAIAAERSRLARDLHDAVTQTLFSASLIAEVLPKIWDKNPDEGRKRLEELRQLARGALAEMRTLLLELRPATLVEASLEELLRHLAEAATGRACIPVSLKVEGKVDIPTDVKIAYYRIAQEALNNIVKHSEASQVTVTLREELDITRGIGVLELVISDDGCGFNPGEVAGEHLGLGIMRERAEAVGAKLTVDSRVNEGTELTVLWEA